MESITVPLGNITLLEHTNKTAFLCSRRIPDDFKPAVFQWLDTLSPDTDCVMCGNLQQVEAEVVDGLIKRRIPTILVLDQPFPDSWPTAMVEAIGDQNLLVLTTSDFLLPWIDKYGMADARNRYMIANANRIVLGFCRPGGLLDKQLAPVDVPIVHLNQYDPSKETPMPKATGKK